MASPEPRLDILQGTLDLLILRTLAAGPMHGWSISERIQQISEEVLHVNQGSLYPLFIAWSIGVGLKRSGERLNWAAAPASIV
jgi:hypothetical protein